MLEGQFGRTVHALVYPPANPEVTAARRRATAVRGLGARRPAVARGPLLDLEKAYFTSRGIGIIDVNYGGSTGYGRRYRERLRRQWGVVDVEDAIAAAQALANAGEADGARLVIRGGSAGGWTALAAVTAQAAAARCSAPRRRTTASRTCAARGHHARLRVPLPRWPGRAAARFRGDLRRAFPAACQHRTCPILQLHGLDDPIVPPAQSHAIAAQLAHHGIRHALLDFAGESHGFRRTETIIAALEAELSFYAQNLGFPHPDTPMLASTPPPQRSRPGPRPPQPLQPRNHLPLPPPRSVLPRPRLPPERQSAREQPSRA